MHAILPIVGAVDPELAQRIFNIFYPGSTPSEEEAEMVSLRTEK